MTEQQREDDLLAELLELPEGDHEAEPPLDAMPSLTRREEQALLAEAHAVGTPTLTPTTTPHDAADTSFAADLVGLVRRYPLPAVLASAGLAMLLARRHHRG
jgi:hypothetical protein